jgi:hypothetical protein
MLRVSLLAVLFTALSAAQTNPAPPVKQASTTPAAQTTDRPAAPMVFISGELSKSLDAQKAQVGDSVEAKVSADLVAGGRIVLARGTKIVGRITAVKRHSKDSPGSSMAVSFDHFVLKDGENIAAKLVLRAVGRPLRTVYDGSASADDSSGPPMDTPGSRSTVIGNPEKGQIPGRIYPVGSSPESTLNSAATPSPKGVLTSSSAGALGLKGVSLTAAGPVTTISSSAQNVHLEGESQLLLSAQ